MMNSTVTPSFGRRTQVTRPSRNCRPIRRAREDRAGPRREPMTPVLDPRFTGDRSSDLRNALPGAPRTDRGCRHAAGSADRRMWSG